MKFDAVDQLSVNALRALSIDQVCGTGEVGPSRVAHGGGTDLAYVLWSSFMM